MLQSSKGNEDISKQPKPRILLCATGSVASVKIPQLAIALSERYQVKILLTKTAQHFVFKVSKTYDPTSKNWINVVETNNGPHDNDGDSSSCCSSSTTSSSADNEGNGKHSVIYVDDDEWKYQKIGDPVLHIELRKWADLLVVAPASANTIAKLASGLSNNLITCVARAWNFSDPIIVCPAMNTLMWEHPFTKQHLDVLLGVGYQIVQPVTKTLACGDTGKGAMASIDTIIATVDAALGAVITRDSEK
jgi:phosphopantothenoylcysteine decarboxylase